MSNPKQAKEYFRLGEQYCEVAKLLLVTLINNGNSNAGMGKTAEEALRKMSNNAVKSDLFLFVPAIFNCIQSTELFIKGLLILEDIGFERKHGVEELLVKLKDANMEKSEVYQKLISFYESQIKIIERFKQANGIKTSYDLYMSLRYPEISLQPEEGQKKGKNISVDYAELFYNGQIGIEQFKVLLERLEAVKLATVKAYNSIY